MFHNSIITVPALLSSITIALVTTADQPSKLAFRKGTSGARFGDLCPRAKPTDDWDAQWSITDLTNFTDPTSSAIWVCPKSGCKINGKNDFSNLYSSPAAAEEPEKVLLQLIPEAKPIHANTYVCETDPFSDAGDTFNYDVTIYDDKLSCSDNVTQHKAGETIELKCGITAWGKGEADLMFQILDEAGVIESTEVHEVASNTEISMKLRLDKSHDKKSLQCNFLGFDKVAADATSTCIVNDDKLNILYTPEITKGFSEFRFAKEGDRANLDCEVEANPSTDPKYVLTGAQGDQKVGGQSVGLTADSSSLMCNATNALGEAISVMKINFLLFNPSFPTKMQAGSSYDLGCGLKQSNQLVEAPVTTQLFVGDDLVSVLPTERLTAKKDWNGQKIICIARRSGNSRADEELLKTETLPLNVEYSPEIICEEQTSNSEYSLRKCALDQNPLSSQDAFSFTPRNVEIEWGAKEDFRQNFTIKIKRSVLAEKEEQKEEVSISVAGMEKKYHLNYTNTTKATTMIVGLVAGIIILIIVVALLIIFLKRGGLICAPKKGGLTDSEKGDSNFPSDDGHGQPPANRSMNGYDNKIPNDDGLVYADLAFSDHQPRSRAPIVDPYSTTDYADIDFGPNPPPYSISDSIG